MKKSSIHWIPFNRAPVFPMRMHPGLGAKCWGHAGAMLGGRMSSDFSGCRLMPPTVAGPIIPTSFISASCNSEAIVLLRFRNLKYLNTLTCIYFYFEPHVKAKRIFPTQMNSK